MYRCCAELSARWFLWREGCARQRYLYTNPLRAPPPPALLSLCLPCPVSYRTLARYGHINRYSTVPGDCTALRLALAHWHIKGTPLIPTLLSHLLPAGRLSVVLTARSAAACRSVCWYRCGYSFSDSAVRSRLPGWHSVVLCAGKGCDQTCRGTNQARGRQAGEQTNETPETKMISKPNSRNRTNCGGGGGGGIRHRQRIRGN